jgi:hypothetical protein
MSAATKWTPGPWIAAEDDAIIISADSRMSANMAEIATVETGWSEPFESEQQANAHLIAQAPLLYTMLDDAITRLDQSMSRSSDDEAFICEARAILSLARGES